MRIRARGWRGRERGGRGSEGLSSLLGIWFMKGGVGVHDTLRMAWHWELGGMNSRSRAWRRVLRDI